MFRPRTGAVLVFAIAMIAAAARSAAQTSELREEDLRIFEVELDDEVLTSDLVGYQHRAGILLPLTELCSILGIAITVQPDDGTASGFIFREERTFHLDVARREVVLGGERKTIEPALIRRTSSEIYVDSTLLSEWLPVGLDIDLFALRIRILPREPLPQQLRRRREERLQQSLAQRRPASDLPLFPSRYDVFGAPFIDQSFRLASRSGATETGLTTFATADLFGLQSSWYIDATRLDGVRDFRVTLGRTHPDPILLAPFHAREFAVGHVTLPSVALIATSKPPRPGALVSSYPLERPTEFASQTFQGDLPPGWDVELYHNDALIGYQRPDSSGRYLFPNVPLQFGFNFFQLVFYGPQGQRRIENSHFVVGQSLTRPGEVHYRVAAARRQDWIEHPDALPGEGYDALVQFDAGLHKRLSASFEAMTLPLRGEQRTYVKGGLRAYLDALFAYGDVVWEREGEMAGEVGIQTRVLGMNLTLSHIEATRDFEAEVFSLAGESLSRRERARLDTAIPPFFLPRIPLTLEYEEDMYQSGRRRRSARNRLSMYYKGFALTNRLQLEQDTRSGQTFEGALQLSRTLRGHSLRGELLYAMRPRNLSAWMLTADGYLSSTYRYSASLTRSFVSESSLVSLAVSKLLGRYAAGVRGLYDTRNGWGVDLDVSIGIAVDPRTGDVVSRARPTAPFGALSARVFLDRNLNGQFDAGDEPIEHAALSIDGTQIAANTDARGIVFIPEIPPHRSAEVQLVTGSLEDPSWLPEKSGIRFIPRPGRAEIIDFPVVITGEIEGTVIARREGRAEPLAGVTIQLVDAAQSIVREVQTAYDGYYAISGIRPGTYAVRIAPTDIARYEIRASSEQPVQVSADGAIAHMDLAVATGREPMIVAEQPAPVPQPPIQTPAPAPPTVARETPAGLLPSVVPLRRESSAGLWYVQAGAFRSKRNAERALTRARSVVEDAYIDARDDLHLVIAGTFRRRENAERTAARLDAAGIDAAVVASSPSSAAIAPPAQRDGGYEIQLGAFRMHRNAIELLRRAMAAGFHAHTDSDGALMLVKIGPFASMREAMAVMSRLVHLGFDVALFANGRVVPRTN